ncbi:hypothetical protein Pla8534_48600 [Lignipirellula cremea]|uniref:Uncharacterized protein n=1 Tax=Lignipirellula cremea TaxID=2528010 RepID=A0A518DZ03_9BACT|nr:hypothetical protein Pla8534_48600 [Lignipirellula cremea]
MTGSISPKKAVSTRIHAHPCVAAPIRRRVAPGRKVKKRQKPACLPAPERVFGVLISSAAESAC